MKTIPAELSWLYFNQCIIDEAANVANPLYERIKFLAIFSSNLDEFFRVKINRLASSKKNKDIALLHLLLEEIQQQQILFGTIWKQQIITELEQNDIIYYKGNDIRTEHLIEIDNYFKTHVLGYIQVVFINENAVQPYFLNNRELYFLVECISKENQTYFAYINIPTNKVNRFKELSKIDNKHYIISLDEIIKNALPIIFNGDTIVACHEIKINRDEDFEIENELEGNIVLKLKHKIQDRIKGVSTRFLYDENMPESTVELCKNVFSLKNSEMSKGGKMHNFFDLFSFPNPLKPLLEKPNYPFLIAANFENEPTIFDAIDNKNQLLHFPYHSYHYVLRFFNQAAIDKNVTHIKVTLYRISNDSLIANALISAAKNGKKVTVFVEVKARFDENNNLRWAEEMRRSGIKIIYSLPNLKVHAKIALVTKKVNGKTKEYAYLSTGNFNEKTATIYTDHGFFTSEKNYTNELKQVFSFLNTKIKEATFNTLLVAGFNLKEQIISKIDNEINNHLAGKPAAIFFKVNGIDEKEVVDKLYEASQKGVKVTLMVRGICTLLPQNKEFSKNISAYRIIDMYLEHGRIYRFHNNGDEQIYFSSADLLSRNLNKRIEVAFPIEDKQLKQEINQIIQILLADNSKKRTILSNGKNQLTPNLEKPKRAQTDIYYWLNNKTI